MLNVWEKVLLYESTDLISRFYQQRHNRELSQAKAKEIVCCINQGKEYFLNAQKAADVVRPLLLYYGVLSLSRGLILFLDPKARENSLRNSHGLEVLDWGNNLSKGIKEFTNLKVRFCNGTFSELFNITKNIERSYIYTGPFPNKIYFKKQIMKAFPVGEKISIKNILARIPDLYSVYEKTFNEFSKCYKVIVFTLSKGQQTDVAIFETELGLPEEELIRSDFKLSKEVSFNFHETNNFFGNIKNRGFRMQHSSLSEMLEDLPPTKVDFNNNIFMVAPTSNNLNFSSLLILFLSAYVMGMLVRYYPSHWVSMIARSKGDFSYPLLKLAIANVETEFPKLFFDELHNV